MNEPVEVWRLPEQEFTAGRRALGWTVGPEGLAAVIEGRAVWLAWYRVAA